MVRSTPTARKLLVPIGTRVFRHGGWRQEEQEPESSTTASTSRRALRASENGERLLRRWLPATAASWFRSHGSFSAVGRQATRQEMEDGVGGRVCGGRAQRCDQHAGLVVRGRPAGDRVQVSTRWANSSAISGCAQARRPCRQTRHGLVTGFLRDRSRNTCTVMNRPHEQVHSSTCSGRYSHSWAVREINWATSRTGHQPGVDSRGNLYVAYTKLGARVQKFVPKTRNGRQRLGTRDWGIPVARV